METNFNFQEEPKYTMKWLGQHLLFVGCIALVLTFVSSIIGGYTSARESMGLLSASKSALVSKSIAYCFAVIAISIVSVMLVELVYRKAINYFQYGLIAVALSLFYLLLLAMAEKMPFALAYTVVSVMIIGLITWFIKEIFQNRKAAGFAAAVMIVEYIIIFGLINLGSIALLVGSLLLFGLIAVAMYFTLKLKIVDDELVLK